MYWVVACSRCRKAKVAPAGQKTTTCGHCGRTLVLEGLRKHLETPDAGQASHAAGLLNARLAGTLDDFEAAQDLAPPPPAPAGPRGRASALRRVASELAAAGPFDARAYARALDQAGLDPALAEDALGRLVAEGVLYEPRPGRFAAL